MKMKNFGAENYDMLWDVLKVATVFTKTLLMKNSVLVMNIKKTTK